MRLRIISFISVLLTAATVTTPAFAAPLPVVGSWAMDKAPIGPNSIVVDTVHMNNGLTPSNWSGTHRVAIAPTGSGAFFMPGWSNLQPGNTIDPTASSYTIPDTVNMNPEKRAFSVSIWVKSLDPTPLVTSGIIVPTDSLNIVQKGLSQPGKSQWKVEENVKGQYICTFRGPDATGTVTDFRVMSSMYSFGAVRKLTCTISATQKITLAVVTGAVTDTFPTSGPAQGPIGGVVNSSPVTVGKKPNTTYPGDAYAGTIDNLIISKN